MFALIGTTVNLKCEMIRNEKEKNCESNKVNCRNKYINMYTIVLWDIRRSGLMLLDFILPGFVIFLLFLICSFLYMKKEQIKDIVFIRATFLITLTGTTFPKIMYDQ